MKILIMLLLLTSLACFAGGEEGTGEPKSIDGDGSGYKLVCYQVKGDGEGTGGDKTGSDGSSGVTEFCYYGKPGKGSGTATFP